MKFHELRIKALQKVTADTVEVTFAIPENLKDVFTFLPGQYLTIAIQVDGETPRRAYSICSDVTKADVSILIKKIEGGKVSSYMNDHATTNQRLLVAAPNGHFKIDPTKVVAKANFIFIGAGSGITPLISMIESLLKTNAHSTCHLYYGSKTIDTIIYRTKLDRLRLVYKDRLVIHHFVSRASRPLMSTGKYGVSYHSGRVDTQYVINEIEQLKSESVNGVYLCGPAELIEQSIEKLETIDLEKNLIHREYFTAPIADAEELEITYDDLPDRSVTVELAGETVALVIKDNKDILRQLMADGYEPPYSCLQGTCSTCKAKLTEGEVKMKIDIGLESDEIEAGYILTCQSIPLSEKTHCIYENPTL